MFKYRLSAPILPFFLLLFLPALAAYPWQMPFGTSLIFPFLTMLMVLFCALRYPGLLFSPIVFFSGLACDLFTRSPLGFWTFLFLITLSCARTTTAIVERFGRPTGWVCFFVSLFFLTTLAWGTASLYQMEWQDPYTSIEGMVMALVLLPLPALFLAGLEKLLILRSESDQSRYRSMS